jgi:hypothetical protein
MSMNLNDLNQLLMMLAWALLFFGLPFFIIGLFMGRQNQKDIDALNRRK